MSGAPFNPTCPPARGLVCPVPVDPTGVAGPTRGQANGPRWVRVGPNAYLPATVDRRVPEQRILEKSVRLPPAGAVTGWAALRLTGAAYFDGLAPDGSTEIPVLLAVGDSVGRRTHPGTVLSYEPLEGREVCRRQGVPATVPRRALFDEMRRTREWRDAVVAMDMAAAAGLVSVRQLAEHHASHRSWRRASVVGKALPYASERSRSPAETRLRLVWRVDAGLPQPLVNREVFDLQGRLICVADLFDPVAGLVVEYDGAEHRKARRHSKDVAREERCRAAGLEYCKITGPDMRTTSLVVDRLLATRGRARFLRPAERRWTLRYPPRWPHQESLDQRLAHREWLAEQLALERAQAG
jgi:hypothetical protein